MCTKYLTIFNADFGYVPFQSAVCVSIFNYGGKTYSLLAAKFVLIHFKIAHANKVGTLHMRNNVFVNANSIYS